MLYFGEVIEGMRQSDEDNRAKRLENSRLYREYVTNNPDATVEQREKYALELGEGSNYLRAALPSRENMEQNYQTRQTKLADAEAQRQITEITRQKQADQYVQDTLTDTFIQSPDYQSAVSTLSQNPLFQNNPYLTKALANPGLENNVTVGAIRKANTMMDDGYNSWLTSGGKDKDIETAISKGFTGNQNNSLVKNSLISRFQEGARQKLQQDTNKFMSVAQAMPDKYKQLDEATFAQELENTLTRSGLTREELPEGALDGILANHKQKNALWATEYNQQQNRVKLAAINAVTKDISPDNFTDPDAYINAIKSAFNEQFGDAGAGLALDENDLNTLRNTFESAYNDKQRQFINSGIQVGTKKDYETKVLSESLTSFDFDTRKPIIQAMGASITAALPQDLLTDKKEGERNIIIGQYAEKTFSMVDRALSRLGLPKGDGSIHRSVASYIASRDKDGSLDINNISMMDVAKAIEIQFAADKSFTFARDAATNGGSLADLIINKSSSATNPFDDNKADEFRSFYITVEGDKRYSEANPFSTDRDHDGKSDFHGASAQEAISIPLFEMTDVTEAVRDNVVPEIDNLEEQIRSSGGQVTDDHRASAKKQALGLQKALQHLQAQEIALKKLGSAEAQKYYKMDDKQISEINRNLDAIRVAAKAFKTLQDRARVILATKPKPQPQPEEKSWWDNLFGD